MQIGLSGSRINPHWLKAGQDVAHENLMETFGKMLPHLGCHHTECWDLEMKTKVEKIGLYVMARQKCRAPT
jgi:hypothetical protein